MARQYRISPHALDVELHERAGALVVRVGGREITIDEYSIGDRYVTLVIGDRTYRYLYAREAGHTHVACDGQSLALRPADEEIDEAGDSAGFIRLIVAPMPGKVLDVLVAVGDRLEAGAPLLLLEAMKMEQTLRTGTAAVVAQIHAAPDDMVGPGQTLVTLEPAE